MLGEQQNTELHYPGTNYLGPGTKVMTNLFNGVRPVSYIDSLAQQHDIDYLSSVGSNFSAIMADLKAIKNSYNEISLQAISMRVGLLARIAFSLSTFGVFIKFNRPINGLTMEETKEAAILAQTAKDKMQMVQP